MLSLISLSIPRNDGSARISPMIGIFHQILQWIVDFERKVALSFKKVFENRSRSPATIPRDKSEFKESNVGIFKAVQRPPSSSRLPGRSRRPGRENFSIPFGNGYTMVIGFFPLRELRSLRVSNAENGGQCYFSESVMTH